MEEHDKLRGDYLHDKDLFKQLDPEEAELAFQLQNARPLQQETIERVVHLFAESLYRWISLFLYYKRGIIPSHQEALSVLQMVLIRAFQNLDQFIDQASIVSWLFGISYSVLKRYKGQSSQDKNIDKFLTIEEFAFHEQFPPSEDLEIFNRLPEKNRLPLLLRYGFDFAVPEIGHILSLPPKEVHNRLARARNQLVGDLTGVHTVRQLQAYIDGLLDDNRGELGQLQQHITGCERCREAIDRFTYSEQSLSAGLKELREFHSLADDELEEVVQAIKREVSAPLTNKKGQLPLKQTIWIIGFAVMFIGLAILFIRLTLTEREFPQSKLSSTQQLPPVISMPFAMSTSVPVQALSYSPQYIDPAFSSDGNWAVFTSVKSDPNTQGGILISVYVYNRDKNSLYTINESTAKIRLLWIWWDMAPSISADGRWIVYVSSAKNPEVKGSACETPDSQPCQDIFLYDRETGITRRLTQGLNGSPANGDSLAPTISADGRWMAFWSAANNLSAEPNSTCQSSDKGFNCLYIYLLNIQSGAIEQIPIRYVPTDVVFGVDRISLSSDGRYAGFTVTSLTQALPPVASGSPISTITVNSNSTKKADTSFPTIAHHSEAIIYDRLTGEYELENYAQDGSLGDGASYSPVISADGRYVAFISNSSNLVPADSNKASDIFIRDRASGKVELVSIDSNGRQGDQPSGLVFGGSNYYSLDVSPDGRYVVFESSAANLGEQIDPNCYQAQGIPCNFLYLRDRQTGTTEQVSALPNGNFSLFPEISTDGRWVSFMESFYNCNPEEYLCSNVVLYDRHSGMTANLTHFNGEASILPWSYLGSLQLPWESWENASLAFSPDGKLLALGGYDSMVRIWQISDGSILKSTPDKIIDTNANDIFSAIAFSANKEWLAAGTVTGWVHIWDLADGHLIYKIMEQPDPIKEIIFSRDGTRLVVTTDYDGFIYTINNDQLFRENTIWYGPNAVYAVDVDKQAKMIATARGDGTVWLQSIPAGKVLARLGADNVAVRDLALSADGTLLVTRTSGMALNLWHIQMKGSGTPGIELVNTFPSTGYAGALVFSPDRTYLASTGLVDQLPVWGIPDGQYYTISTVISYGEVDAVTFSDQGDKLAVVFQNQISLWGIPGSAQTRYFIHSPAGGLNNSDALVNATANDLPEFRPAETTGDEQLSLHQLAAYFPKLQVPIILPAEFSLQETRFFTGGDVLLRYSVSGTQEINDVIYFYEIPVRGTHPATMTVGLNANIVAVPVDKPGGATMAEYVRGDWVPLSVGSLDSDRSSWQWVETSSSQRLRWLQDGVLFAIYYRVDRNVLATTDSPGQGNSLVTPTNRMTREEMVQIAQGMVKLDSLEYPALVFVPYTIQPGDTCTGIADTFGTSIYGLTSVNDLNQECDIIAGQEIQIPAAWYPWRELDLNCDSKPERVETVRKPLSDAVFGISLSQIGRLGLYESTWQYLIQGGSELLLSQPTLFTTGGCERLLAFSVEGGDHSGLKIFSWKDGQMSLILTDPGFPSGIIPQNTPVLTITTLRYGLDQGSGVCLQTSTAYTWAGDNFELVSQETTPADGCATQE